MVSLEFPGCFFLTDLEASPAFHGQADWEVLPKSGAPAGSSPAFPSPRAFPGLIPIGKGVREAGDADLKKKKNPRNAEEHLQDGVSLEEGGK